MPHLIEAVTQIIDTTKKPEMLHVSSDKSIEHHMKQGKQGVIDITVGNPQSIHKDVKTKHLLIVSTDFTNISKFCSKPTLNQL